MAWQRWRHVGGASGGGFARGGFGEYWRFDGGAAALVVRTGLFAPVVGGGLSATLGTASESDAALALGRSTARGIGLASESDAALALGRGEARAISWASESDSALPLTGGLSISLVAANENDSALVLGRSSARGIGWAIESDLALPLSGSAGGPIGSSSSRRIFRPTFRRWAA